MVEDKNTQLTEDETELYDRQIRLWGVESQQRLRNARVLVIGLDGLGAEIVKNLVLSGVKSVLMLDDKNSTAEDSSCQFLIPTEEIGKNRAEASRQRAQNLNPLVSIETDIQPISEKPDEFLHDFEVVISVGQDLVQNLRLDGICRSKGIAFLDAGVYGTYGYIFYDYNEHSYTMEYTSGKKGEDAKKRIETAEYPSMESVFDMDVTSPDVINGFLKSPPCFFLLKVIYRFRKEFGRAPTLNEDDISVLVNYRDELLKGVSYPKEYFPDILLRCVSSGKLSPICAIVGAVASQEVVKVVTKKDTPHNNFFFFNPFNLSGFIQAVGPASQ